MANPEFEPSLVKNASKACEGICKWIRALDIYDRVIKVVAPKKVKLAEAEAELGLQMQKLNEKRAELKTVGRRAQPTVSIYSVDSQLHSCLQCIDAVGWPAGRASGL